MTGAVYAKPKSMDPEDKNIREILQRCLKGVKNGSLTIVKQDGHVIQVNKNEKYLLTGNSIFMNNEDGIIV